MPDHLPGSMEISKSLHEEIVAVQQKLQKAILEHQVREKESAREGGIEKERDAACAMAIVGRTVGG